MPEQEQHSRSRRRGTLRGALAIVAMAAAVVATPAEVDVGTNLLVGPNPNDARQVLPDVAVNPTDRRNIIVVSREELNRDIAFSRIRRWVSRDGGQSWTTGILPFYEFNRQGSATVTFCASGVAFAAYKDINPDYVVRVLRSFDGGETWEARTPARTNAATDNSPQIVCDDSGGAFTGRLFVRYGRQGHVYLVHSDDEGATWSAEVKITTGSQAASNLPGPLVVGPNSELWIAWRSAVSPYRMFSSRSLDGGDTWETPEKISEVWGSPPVLAIDRSGGTLHGTAYAVFRTEVAPGDDDLFFSRRIPGPGGAWLPPVRLNDDPPGKRQEKPWVTVDPDGVVRFIWLDMRNDPGDGSTEVYGKITRDGGTTFEPDFPYTDQPYLEATGTDAERGQTRIVASENISLPFWPDRRNDDGDVYTAAVRDFSLVEVGGVRVGKNGGITVSWTSQDPTYGEETVYDIVSGFLDELQADGGYDRAACLADDVPDSPYTDTRTGPAAGFGYYYLVRSQNAAADSSFGAMPVLPDARVGLDLEAPCN